MKKIKDSLQRSMLRPFLYLTFTRLVLGLFLVLIMDFFLASSAGRDLRGTLFLLAGVLFALMGWIAYLRFDGIQLPKPMMLRLGIRKKPARGWGDMIDFVDEEPEDSFDGLEEGEKDICLLGADMVCCAVFLAASFII